MIRAVIFDLDGVLVDADKLHFDALNEALRSNNFNQISWQEHLTIYKGLPTKKKLEILTERRWLPISVHDKLLIDKQHFTRNKIDSDIKPDAEKIAAVNLLARRGLKIAVCSNAIKDSVHRMLKKAGLLSYQIDLVMGNEDVKNPKPSPEIYIKALEKLGVTPEECLIVEDSQVGKQAAYSSGAFVCEVEGPDNVNYYKVLASILDAQEVNVVIPASGYGKRFAESGYIFPKPMIDVDGKPMLALVLDTLVGVAGKVFIIMRGEHTEKYCVDDILAHLSYGVNIIEEEGIPRGAATSVLIAKPYIDTNNELIIANSDQYLATPIISWFVDRMRTLNADGGMITFDAEDKKWSYAREENGLVVEVAEKNPISRNATAGVYYYRRGKDFVRWAEQMIRKNIRVNNEFYVCPVFNEAIADGAKIYTHAINPGDMHGLGTPEDLERFLSEDSI